MRCANGSTTSRKSTARRWFGPEIWETAPTGSWSATSPAGGFGFSKWTTIPALRSSNRIPPIPLADKLDGVEVVACHGGDALLSSADDHRHGVIARLPRPASVLA